MPKMGLSPRSRVNPKFVKFPTHHQHLRTHDRGFALIVTLSLMILLTIIAVGLLTLSSISLRASSATVAMAEARQNARLSMQMAIAQLQSLTGPDTRVTAPRHPDPPTSSPDSVVPVTGAWRSWEGTDREADGRPKVPSYANKKEVGNPAAMPESAGAGRFLGWLTSSAEGKTADFKNVPEISNNETEGYVSLLSDGSVSEAKRRVFIKPTMVRSGQGAIAWWTSGENSKAMVNSDKIAKPSTTVAWHQRVRSNGRADSKSFGLEQIENLEPGNGNVISTATLDLINPSQQLRKFHDLTAYSPGLLTNTATGGWRKDLSWLSERYASLPSTGLPSFTTAPGKVQTFNKAQPSSHPANALLYHWGRYRASPSSSGWAQVPPICSWDALVDYMRQYASVSSSSASRTTMPNFVFPHYGADNRYNFQDKVRRSPQIARIHWIYSLASVVATATNEPDATKHGRHKPALMVTPVLTLWNPYNVELTVSSFGINIQETAPLRFRFKVGTTVFPETSLTEISKAGTGYQRFFLKVNQSITLPPGGTRIFGLNDPKPKENAQANDVVLTPGYRPNGGFLFYGINKGANVYAAPGEPFSVDKMSYDAMTNEGGKTGIGIIYDIHVDGGSRSAHRMIYDTNELGGPTVLNSLYPPITSTLSTTVGEVEGIKNQPFASAIFGYRMASPPSRDPRHRHLYSKGMLQSNPLCFYTEIGFGDDANAISSMQGTGVYHPINAPYDFAFQEVQGWNDTIAIPQYDSGTNSSYIVSGLSAGDGLTRCVMAELPTRPLMSLAELQHFDARNNNPITPFQFNLIGNGSAHPVFGPDQLYVNTGYNNGMCNDDGYILNHVLFDDWFISSIAPELRDFSPSTKRSMQKVYEDHLALTTPLPNRFYRPAIGAASPSVSSAAATMFSTAKDRPSGLYQYELIASKLDVEGMFNINSTSVEAWKALLRHGRDLQVPYLAPNGSTNNGQPVSFTYPRTSIAGDQGTDSGSKASNPLFSQAAEFAGHRVLTDAQIEALAEQIVLEIRKRGPFLSLSEFVNRQLTTDKDLAIAGTIQKALDNLANLGTSPQNPFAALQSLSVNISSQPPGKTDYKFPEAASGSSAFGTPGWVRQADVLRPLAPIISARDDTFTIRAYGDSRDRSNPQKIVARAWCEVLVRRQAAYVDSSESEAITPHSALMKSEANKRFGRRYDVISFRWLDMSEV